MCWPRPVRSRANSAAEIAWAAVTAVVLSGDNGPDHTRLAGVAVALDVGEAGDRLDDRVIDPLVGVGTGLAEAAHRDVDNVRPDLPDDVLAQAHPFDRARAVVLNQHIRRRHQLSDDLQPGRGLDVDTERSFRPVARQERPGHAAVLVTQLAQQITCGWLDLDDVGALVGEHHGGDRPGHDHGQIQHPDAGQWPLRFGLGHRPLRSLLSHRSEPCFSGRPGARPSWRGTLPGALAAGCHSRAPSPGRT